MTNLTGLLRRNPFQRSKSPLRATPWESAALVLPSLIPILVLSVAPLLWGISLAFTKFLTTVAGEQIHISVSLATGNTAGRPLNGSRMISLAKLLAACVGFPALTVTVGRRTARPSRNPRRE